MIEISIHPNTQKYFPIKAVDGWSSKPSSHCFLTLCTTFELELTQLFILPIGICTPGLIISINSLSQIIKLQD